MSLQVIDGRLRAVWLFIEGREGSEGQEIKV